MASCIFSWFGVKLLNLGIKYMCTCQCIIIYSIQSSPALMNNAYSLQGQSHCSRSSSENSRDKNLRARTGTGLEHIPGSHSKRSEASGRRFTPYSSGAYFGGEAFPQEIWVDGYKGTTEGKPLITMSAHFKKKSY